MVCSVVPIKIKTERDVELHLGFKTELHQPSTSTDSSSNNWKKEKDGLIYQIENLKAELQRVVASMSLEKEKLNEEISAKDMILKQKEELQLLLTQLQIKFDNMEEQHANSIGNLTRENRTLTAQIKQLQCGISQQQSLEYDKEKSKNDAHAIDDDNVYDVEEIIDHKGGKNSRQYRVRWKGYGIDDDTWETESKLECVLCKYKKMKNIK